MTQLFEPTVVDQIAEIEREITLRGRVYPRWIADRKLTAEKAQRQIECLQAAVATLRGIS